MTLRVSELTFGVLKQRRAFGVAVSEAEIVCAMRYAHKMFSLILEPGGSVGLAAMLSGKIKPGKRTLVILSGGNIEPEQFAAMTGG
jgi:threonine dehydratase